MEPSSSSQLPCPAAHATANLTADHSTDAALQTSSTVNTPPSSSILGLPPRCLGHVFTFLTPSDARKFMLTCRAMRALHEDWPMWAAWLMRHKRSRSLHVAARGDKPHVISQIMLLQQQHHHHNQTLNRTRVQAADQRTQPPPQQLSVNHVADASMHTPLHIACMHNRAASAQLLLSLPLINPMSKDASGNTPLHLACERGHAAMVQILLAAPGVAITEGNMKGQTPLHRAAACGHADVVQLLLAAAGHHGGPGLNLGDQYSCTALHLAVLGSSEGHRAVAQMLLGAQHIEVNARSSENGETPLQYAARVGSEPMVSMLLAAPLLDINAQRSDGQTTLHIAVNHGHCAVLRRLLSAATCNANMQDAIGCTPLHHAAMLGQVEVVQELLGAAGSVNVGAVDQQGSTAEALAAGFGNAAVVQLLQAGRQARQP